MSKINSNVPGTIPNSQNFQVLVSSGIPSLDKLLGDGIPIGTITLIEEDTQGTYARILLKYFLAEGAVNKHAIFLATQDLNPDEIVTHLPELVKDEAAEQKSVGKDQMKIAFRYTDLPTNDPQVKQEFGHYFDLSSTMSKDILEKVDVKCWPGEDDKKTTSSFFKNPMYEDLLESIKFKLRDGKYFLTDKPVKRNLLRIGIYGLGSPLWMSNNYEDSKNDLNKFFLCLRALIRSACAVAVVTMPSHLYYKFDTNKCVSISDISIRLEALAGTELEHNKFLSDYNGFFHIDKLAAINTFASKHPGPVEYTFKLRRRKFTIEVLHLPPDLELSEDWKTTLAHRCGSNANQALDF